MDFSIKLSSGLVLKGLLVSPGEGTRAVVVLVHGLGEHIRRYLPMAEIFKGAGIGFIGVDLPGHGSSAGRRGHIRNYGIVREMIDILVKSSGQTFPGLPLYLYGHSLGGGIVLEYILRNKPRISGAIVTSPWIRLSFEPSKFKLFLASVVRYIFPGFVQPSGLIIEHISHDTEVLKQYKADPLIHDRISVSLLHSAMNAGHYILQHASESKLPVLMLHGSNDMITSPEGSREFALLNSKTVLKIFEGGYHELHNEPFRKEVFDYIIEWVYRGR